MHLTSIVITALVLHMAHVHQGIMSSNDWSHLQVLILLYSTEVISKIPILLLMLTGTHSLCQLQHAMALHVASQLRSDPLIVQLALAERALILSQIHKLHLLAFQLCLNM